MRKKPTPDDTLPAAELIAAWCSHVGAVREGLDIILPPGLLHVTWKDGSEYRLDRRIQGTCHLTDEVLWGYISEGTFMRESLEGVGAKTLVFRQREKEWYDE